ncbi:MAG: serine/threonine protein kinase with domain [Deltaproteobacteria bacterium]|nr:serine/threonine protein kinase with domain [Deltaproteobacteria bacterium]
MIEAFRLGVFSRGATLWDGLDFAFGDAAAWVVVGPPSSGKTLLLSILRGDRRPDAGDVVVSGESLFRGNAALARSYRASCGHVPEQTVTDARLTVGDLFRRSALVGFGVRESERKDRSDRLLAMVGVPGAWGWRIAEMSTSERVRTCLATEPAGIPYREMLWGLFRALAREGNTVVLAERTIPEGWAVASGAGLPVGPFRSTGCRFPIRKETSVERNAFPVVDRLAPFARHPRPGDDLAVPLFLPLRFRAPVAAAVGRGKPFPCRSVPSRRCSRRTSLPPKRKGWRERSPPSPRCAPRCTGTLKRRGRSS